MRSSSVSSSDSDNNRNQKSSSQSKSRPQLKADAKTAQVARSFKVKISQLAKNVTEGHLKEIFSVFGDVLSVQMPSSDHKYLPSKRQVMIEFAKKNSVEAAVELMNGGEVNGCPIIVSSVTEEQTRERSRELEKPKREDATAKKDAFNPAADVKDKKAIKAEDSGRKSQQRRDKEKSDKQSKKNFSGRFNRKDKKYRDSSKSSSNSSKNDSSGTSRSSTSSLSGSSSENSSD